MATVFLKLRIFLSGACFSEKTKNSPNAMTTNSAQQAHGKRNPRDMGYVINKDNSNRGKENKGETVTELNGALKQGHDFFPKKRDKREKTKPDGVSRRRKTEEN